VTTVDGGSALARARDTLQETAAAVRATQLTVAEDHPDRPLSALTDRKLLADLDEALVEEMAVLHEAIELAAALVRREEADGDPRHRLARDLAAVHRLQLRSGRRLREGLLSADRVAGLRRLSRQLGPPWVIWARVTLDGLSAARASSQQTDDALVDAWFSLIAAGPDPGRPSHRPSAGCVHPSPPREGSCPSRS
jgi:hypothetical protein